MPKIHGLAERRHEALWNTIKPTRRQRLWWWIRTRIACFFRGHDPRPTLVNLSADPNVEVCWRCHRRVSSR